MKTSIKLFALAMIVLASGWQESKAATMEDVVPVCLKAAKYAGMFASLRDVGGTTDTLISQMPKYNLSAEKKEYVLRIWFSVKDSKLSRQDIESSMFITCLMNKGK